MAADYTSGSASSFADLLTALEAFLTTVGGWTGQAGPAASGDFNAQRILSKGDMVYRFATRISVAGFYCIPATGISGSNTTGDAPFGVKMAQMYLATMTFPITYEIFWNDTPEEVYIVISYSGNKYQHLHFGESDQAGIGGTGAWLSGSIRTDNPTETDTNYSTCFITDSDSGEGTQYIYPTPYAGVSLGYFIDPSGGYSYPVSQVHCGLDDAGSWRHLNDATKGLRGPWNTDLLMSLPSTYNEAEVLISIHSAVQRPDNVRTLILSLRHARFMRIDNVDPGQIITYGGDQWKCYPMYAKNTVNRNGVDWSTGAQHSGTLGVAIRYPGV